MNARTPARLEAVVVAVVAAVVGAAPAAAVDTVTTPFSGGRLTHSVTETQDFWVLEIELCAAGISFAVTSEEQRGRTVPSFASLVGASAAINGDFGDRGPPFMTDGPAMHDGVRWGGVDHGYVAPIAFGPAHIAFPHMNNESELPPWAREVVSGHPTLLDDGAVVGNPGDPLCTVRHPRTAMGITADHRKLVWLVADGRRAGAAGLTCDEEAFILASFGAFDAVNMDGGGSSTMVVNGAVQNRPSDGSPRVVSNHLALFAAGSGPAPYCPDFVDPVCDGDANLQRCDGTVITKCEDGAPVANGDCGFFGAGCSVEGGSAHCVHPFCLQGLDGGETGTFCKDDTNVLATCTLGVYEEGDCGFFGATCSEAGGSGHCVHPFCPAGLDGGEDGSFCVDADTRASCTLGQYVEEECGALPCVTSSTTRASCGAPPAEGEGEGDVGEGEGEEGEGEEGEGEEGEGEEGEGEGEAGEGEEGDTIALPPSVQRSSCASTSTSTPAALALLSLVLRRMRRVRTT
jgi:hypothetical protein